MPQETRKSRQRVRTQAPANGGFSVNERLTPKRTVEAAEYGSAVRRMVRALGRRGSEGDVLAAAELGVIREALDEVTQTTVQDLHARHNYTWGDIGRAFGISRQAAQQRWGRP